jgi:hypothetical protein
VGFRDVARDDGEGLALLGFSMINGSLHSEAMQGLSSYIDYGVALPPPLLRVEGDIHCGSWSSGTVRDFVYWHPSC